MRIARSTNLPSIVYSYYISSMANTSENSPDLNEHSIELQARNNSSTLSVDFQLASQSTDSVLSDETHRCPLPLRRHAIAFYIVVAFLWGILLIPTVMFFVPIDRLEVSDMNSYKSLQLS